MSLQSAFRAAGRSFRASPVAQDFKLPLGFSSARGAGTMKKASGIFYELFLRRTSTYLTLIFVTAAVAENTNNDVWNSIWKSHNKGKLFPDVVGNFPAIPPNCEE